VWKMTASRSKVSGRIVWQGGNEAGLTERCEGVACHGDAFELPVGWGVPAYAEEIASQD